MKLMLRLVLAVCSAAVCAPVAAGCPCEPISVSKARGRADAVFAGTVLDSHRERTAAGFEWRVRVSVEQTWKGEAAGTVVFYTSGECAVQFAAGRKYLVFARMQEGRGRLFTDACSRTAALGEPAADEDLRRLGRARQPRHNARGR